ncbi:hypothetical protein LCGC14_0475480 [marine sediment metagenome]|uniref:Uncharacterized protein n=1 Tax=marine sediment metagenome TaxID=412755 RepID=A0A0F9SAZ8_9ZZZZ
MTVKERWVLKNMPKCGVDILNSDFVDLYIAAFNPVYRLTNWGAYKCPQLGKLLSQMFKKNILERGTISLGINWEPGFPKWVYSYSIVAVYKPYAENLRN